jgi:hypothetical protein
LLLIDRYGPASSYLSFYIDAMIVLIHSRQLSRDI